MSKQILHPLILNKFPKLKDNKDQQTAIGTIDGPVLIIAGPGSGKTFVLVLRTLNILLKGLAKPEEIVLCSFTEKSAFELRDRLYNFAKLLGYKEKIGEVKVGTIHGISNDFILRNRHFTDLGNNYEVLDELTQLLFIFDNFKKIVGEKKQKYLGRWTSKWGAIEGLSKYFNKITEEMIDVNAIMGSKEKFVQEVADCYAKYKNVLSENNKIDFSFIQKYYEPT